RRQVDHAERRATVAADEALGLEAMCRVQLGLHQREANEGLGAGDEDPAGVGFEVVFELVLGAQCRYRHARIFGPWARREFSISAALGNGYGKVFRFPAECRYACAMKSPTELTEIEVAILEH